MSLLCLGLLLESSTRAGGCRSTTRPVWVLREQESRKMEELFCLGEASQEGWK